MIISAPWKSKMRKPVKELENADSESLQRLSTKSITVDFGVADVHNQVPIDVCRVAI
jgi:hypothetical protein